jgi:hypothetical protein
MSALAWLAIPVVALVLAIAWVTWAGRERPRADTHDTVLAHERFKAALERPRPPAPRSPDPSSGRSADREHDVLS